MTIILRIDSILNELFPNYLKYGKDINVLVQDLTEYYTSGPYKPTVKIKDNLIHVEIDIPTIKTQQDDYDKAVKLCDQGKYEYAIPILNKLIKKNPSVSEYHRILGQVYFDQGKHEEAINYFIDALKWDTNNPSALIMMGNVLSIYKDDIKSALKYYDQALTNKPNDNILLNNIGANLLKLNRLDEGLRYLEIAYESDPDYTNTLYNLTLFYDIKEDYQSVFDWGIKTMRGSSLSDQVHKPAYQMVIKACKVLADKINQKSILEKYLLRLEDISEYPIEIVADNSITYPARIEYAEVHSRDKHIIRHKENYPYITHIVMHELGHLELALSARKSDRNRNMLFTTNESNKQTFLRDFESTANKLQKTRFSKPSIDSFMNSLFEGINLQIFNTPIDLFIENKIYEEFPEFRPVQFLSVDKIIGEGIIAVTGQAGEMAPRTILNASKILNMVLALQFGELFGFDYMLFFKADPGQLRTAGQLFGEYADSQKNYNPGDEYTLIDSFARVLKLDKYFELIPETEYFKLSDIEGIIDKSGKNPDSAVEEFKKDALKYPLSYERNTGEKMEIMFYCLDALKLLSKLSKEEIKNIGFEIAMLGEHGIDPNNPEKRFHLASVPGTTFTGKHLLAFMYSTWKEIDPTIETGLDFKEEYEWAKMMLNKD